MIRKVISARIAALRTRSKVDDKLEVRQEMVTINELKEAVDVFCEPNRQYWGEHWLCPNCTVLRYARDCCCDFNDEASQQIDRLRQIPLESSVPAHSGDSQPSSLVDVVKYFLPGEPKDTQTSIIAIARVVTGIIAAIDAAIAIRNWRSSDTELPPSFAESITTCLKAYTSAWSLELRDEPLVAQRSVFHDQLVSETPDIDGVLKLLSGNGVPLTSTSRLMLRRLLRFVLGQPDPEPVFETESKLLLFNRLSGQGVAGPVTVQTAVEGQFGFYVDPVVMGMTIMDQTMTSSLRDSWILCRSELENHFSQTLKLHAIRLSPQVPCSTLVGRSAGGLLACAMYAAATRTPLNSDASASFVIELDKTNPTADATIKPENVHVLSVVDNSVVPKLKAAKDAGMQRVVLERRQAEKLCPNETRNGLHVPGVETLAQAFEHLTGDARKERVLAAYCRQQLAEWAARRRDPDDPDKLRHFVKFHYSKLPEGLSSDTSGRAARDQHEDKRSDPYQALAEQGDSWRMEIGRLVRLSPRLCITEDAGAGKSIFTRFLVAFLSSPNTQRTLFQGKARFVVRFERGVHAWPERADDYETQLVEQIKTATEKQNPGLKNKKVEEKAREVVTWALKHARLVLVMDGLDQVADNQITALSEFLNSDAGKKCRVIVTGRSQALNDRQIFSQVAGWQYARIDGFDRQQQEKYLRGCYVSRLEELFPNYEEVSDLLRVPVVLSFVRELAEDRKAGQILFHTRAELYLHASRKMIRRAATKVQDAYPQLKHLDASHLLETVEPILAAVAFSMMKDEVYAYVVRGVDEVGRIRRCADAALSHSVDPEQWQLVHAVSDLTNRCILEGSTEDLLSFKHRGMMEFYCGLHLARNTQKDWVSSDDAGRIACGDRAVGQFASDRKWYWPFRFAIELPSKIWDPSPDTLCATLSELFRQPPKSEVPGSEQPGFRRRSDRKWYWAFRFAIELLSKIWDTFCASLSELFRPPPKLEVPGSEQPGFRRRPTELMGRAWPLLDPKLNDPAFQELDPNRDTLPRGPEVIDAFRATSKGVAERFTFVRCPKNPTDDRKPFEMGDDTNERDNTRPKHAVTVTPFEMAMTTVTRALFAEFDRGYEQDFVWFRQLVEYAPEQECPAIHVIWWDAWIFAKWLGEGYRLPTEAEWEYACRAGSTTAYCFGDDERKLKDYAWYGENSGNKTHPVGKRQANAWGLYDMHGNVWEWCSDWFTDVVYRVESESADPTGPTTGSYRVFRGGSWGYRAWVCRSANRHGLSPELRFIYLGFRVALSSARFRQVSGGRAGLPLAAEQRASGARGRTCPYRSERV